MKVYSVEPGVLLSVIKLCAICVMPVCANATSP